MNIIKFEQNFDKLNGEYEAKLLQIFRLDRSHLSHEFVSYDTSFKGGAYHLPRTWLIVLLFRTPGGHLFTTCRRARGRNGEDNFKYYRNLIGRNFKLEISGEINPYKNDRKN